MYIRYLQNLFNIFILRTEFAIIHIHYVYRLYNTRIIKYNNNKSIKHVIDFSFYLKTFHIDYLSKSGYM